MACNKDFPDFSNARYALKKVSLKPGISSTLTLSGYSILVYGLRVQSVHIERIPFRSGASLPFACSLPKEV